MSTIWLMTVAFISDGTKTPIHHQVRLCYDTTRPHEITADFAPSLPELDDETARIRWIISRDILHAGLWNTHTTAGLGDVRTRSNGYRYTLTLTGRTQSCTATFSSFDISGFLARVYNLVPIDAEMDEAALDAEIAALMGE